MLSCSHSLLMSIRSAGRLNVAVCKNQLPRVPHLGRLVSCIHFMTPPSRTRTLIDTPRGVLRCCCDAIRSRQYVVNMSHQGGAPSLMRPLTLKEGDSFKSITPGPSPTIDTALWCLVVSPEKRLNDLFATSTRSLVNI